MHFNVNLTFFLKHLLKTRRKDKKKEKHGTVEEKGTALLEIGTEELPPQFFFDACEQLEQLLKKKLGEKRLVCGKISVTGTPRRLTAQIDELNSRQPDQTKEVKGPSKSAAYDASGNPTGALLGFAKSQGISVDTVKIKDFEGKPYAFALIHEKGESTLILLNKIFPEVIQSLSFPKAMRWDGKFTFGRPVRWITALFENEIISFKIENLESGRATYGHRFLSKGPVEIKHPSEYEKKLKSAFVIPETEARKRLIQTQIKNLADTKSAQIYPSNHLMEEVNLLVEYPTAFVGNFDQQFLSLPEEVLVTVMQHHQRYFPLISQKKKLLPHFIGVRNGDSEGIDEVIKGNEQVLKARFKDAQYFFENDKKRKLRDRQKDLSKLVFQKNLGTLEQKIERLKNLSIFLKERILREKNSLSSTEDLKCLDDIVSLCKCDLTTQMVFEFTELQGVMGKEYAQLEGYPETVCQGILDHYLPRFQGDSFPKTLPGAVIGITDRIDTLTGSFGLKLAPKGSSDPLGLRRSAATMLQILIEKKLDIDLEKLIEEAEAQYKEQQIKLDLNLSELEIFILERCETVWKTEGIRYDLFRTFKEAVAPADHLLELGVRASYSSPCLLLKKPFQSFRRAKFLENLREKEKTKFVEFILAWVRIFNILKSKEAQGIIQSHTTDKQLGSASESQAGASGIVLEQFNAPEEKTLYDRIKKLEPEITAARGVNDIQKTYELLSSFQSPINLFFDKILVMDPDETLRKNRILLLKNLRDLMQESFGEITQIVMD